MSDDPRMIHIWRFSLGSLNALQLAVYHAMMLLRAAQPLGGMARFRRFASTVGGIERLAVIGAGVMAEAIVGNCSAATPLA